MKFTLERIDPDQMEEDTAQRLALALLLANDVLLVNSFWWEKDCPKYMQESIALAVDCSDTFAYASADAEPLTHDELPALYKLWSADEIYGPIKWCALKRRCRPLPRIVERLKGAGLWDESMDRLTA